MNEVKQLIDDTLSGRRISRQGQTCFVVNLAGQELLQCGANISNALHDVISNIDRSIRDGSSTVGEFPGLGDVLGAYLVNCARFGPMPAVEFMRTLSAELLAEFIANMPVVFNRLKSGYIFGIATPIEYIDFVKSQCDADDVKIASVAKRTTLRLSKQRQADG